MAIYRPTRPVGFDRSHFAAANCVFSGVGAARPINLITGAVGADWTGTVSGTGFDADVGIYMQPTANEGHVWPAMPPGTVMSAASFAGIGVLNNCGIFHSATGNPDGGNALAYISGKDFAANTFTLYTTASVGGSLVYSNNVPYFYVAATRAGLGHLLLLNLLTGAITTSTGSGNTPGTNPAGNVSWPGNFSSSASARLARAATFNGFITQEMALRWAKDPWLFWHPLRKNIAPSYSYAAAAGGTTTPWTVNVTCTTSVSLTKQVSKSIAVNCASTVSLVKSIAKSVAVTCTGTVTRTKQVAKSVAVTCTGTVSQLHSIGKSIALTCSGAVSVVKSVGKRVNVTATMTVAAISAIRVFLQTINVTCTTTVATIGKSVGKNIAVTVTGSVTMARAIGKSVAVVCTGTVTTTKAIAKRIAVTCSLFVSAIGNFINGSGTKIRTLNVTIKTGSIVADITE